MLRKPIPFSVVFALTYRCQCNCIHCSVGDYKKNEYELSDQEIKAAIDFINSWGPVKITFFGGEPLLRENLVGLVDYAAKKGIRVSLDTNGLLLDEKLVIDLKNSGVANINISLDSSTEHIHDALRDKQGCFQSAIKAIQLCVKHKIPCLISTYASKRSVKESDLKKIIELAKKMGASGVKVLFPILSGKWREADEEKLNSEEEEYVNSIMDPSFVYLEDALEMVKRNGKGCSALEKNLIYISPYGDIQPCPAIPITFGNIRDTNIREIVEQMYYHEFFRKYKSCQVCLMNDINFRIKYFSIKENNILPINVKEV
jgi:MoaA/NifB/PqqE/SkfB family radical SAM enzyme